MSLFSKKEQKKWKRLGNQFSVKRAVIYILISTLLISGSIGTGLIFYKYKSREKRNNSNYNIIAILQSTSGSEKLKTIFFSELLELSIDHPKNLYNFSLHEAEVKLLTFPLIKQVQLSKVSPGTLFISYELRNPVAYLGDLSNTAIDTEGVIIPFKPFFSPKKLPTIYFGQECLLNHNLEEILGKKMDGFLLEIAFSLCHLMSQFPDLILEQIDLSRMCSESYGRREIILKVSKMVDDKKALFLRLNSKNYLNSLEYFKIIRPLLQEKIQIVDLRIEHFALIS